MRKRENKLIHDPIHAHGPTNKLERRVRGIRKNKTAAVESRQRGAADAARQRRHVVHVGRVHHGAHRSGHRARRELVRRVLVPDRLEVELRASENCAQKSEAARV